MFAGENCQAKAEIAFCHLAPASNDKPPHLAPRLTAQWPMHIFIHCAQWLPPTAVSNFSVAYKQSSYWFTPVSALSGAGGERPLVVFACSIAGGKARRERSGVRRRSPGTAQIQASAFTRGAFVVCALDKRSLFKQ
jgi:hypothetical protein